MRLPFDPAKVGLSQALVDLAMTRDGLVTISVGPDVVVPASSKEPPARAGEPFLEIAAFHGSSVHESGYDWRVISGIGVEVCSLLDPRLSPFGMKASRRVTFP